jgi:hypothetical protein
MWSENALYDRLVETKRLKFARDADRLGAAAMLCTI